MKTTEKNQILYHLIRDYMYTMGTSRTTIVALKSYIDAIQRLNCTEQELKGLVLELNEVLKKTEPKIVSLAHLIEVFEEEMKQHWDSGMEAFKSRATAYLEQQLKRFEADTKSVTAQCAERIEPGDFIITSSPTEYLSKAFILAHTALKKQFKVLVLKQDYLRTRDMVNTLENHGIEYVLIPQYNLSHFLGKANKLFIGAVSISTDQKAVTGFGTANVVSICHTHNVPVYLFIETLKFSHTPLQDQHIYMEKKDIIESDTIFHMTSFSNDFVDLNLINHLVTEKGERMRP
ncbi:MAG: hypothetical protein C4522_14345 [Desulfobacteraceae bacterium]|nr:MAG: hypothetical protein C4522_14345 [Desulfobacteraceae bacterium]